MKIRHASGFALASAVVSAAVAACSATSSNTFATTSGSGGSGATGPMTGGGGGFVFADAGPEDASTDQHTGPTDCDSSCPAAGGTCVNGTCVITQNPGNVDDGTKTALTGGGTGDAAFTWLYPYDKTVFPRGLLPPTLQFGGGAPDAVYVRVSFPGMEYQGFFGGSNPGRVTLPAPAWTAITSTATGLDEVKVDVTKISGGVVTGPITETWTIAQGSLRGTIYYETYDSQLAGGLGSVGIMKIQPGAATPTVLKTGCGNVCHTASADGSTMVAATSLLSSASYDLKNNASPILLAGGIQFTYGGIYPDGSFVMSATHYRTWLFNAPHLYDTKTGEQIPAPGWDNVLNGSGTPSFSPDGKRMAFNHEDTGGGRTLAVMDFDNATKTFSNLVDVASDNSRTLAWPAFTPDGKWIVYHAGSNEQFETDNGATGDLFYTSATANTPVRLDSVDGYQNGQSYLPANDPNLSFAPTVLPEAVGGYFWVVFTSHRSYGNTLPSLDGPSGSPGEYGKLWVAAFDLNPTPGKDPSHPAFFLDGQEAHADNLRGFWVLDPCKPTGSSCSTGDECCEGFCRPDGDGGPLACVPPPAGGCANEFEKCAAAADCCDADAVCINGHCAKPPPK